MNKILKQIIYVILILTMIIGISTNVKAEDTTKQLKVVLSEEAPTKSSVEDTTKVTYNFKIELTDFVGIEEGKTAALNGTINYDETVFETPTINGENGWTATFNSANGEVLFDTGSLKKDQSICIISLNVKDNVEKDKITQLNITNLKISVDNDYNTTIPNLSSGNIVLSEVTTSTSNNHAKVTEENDDNKNSEEKNEVENDIIDDTNKVQTTDDSGNEIKLSNKIDRVGSLDTNDDPTLLKNTLPETGKIAIEIILCVLLIFGILIGLRYIIIKRTMDGK